VLVIGVLLAAAAAAGPAAVRAVTERELTGWSPFGQTRPYAHDWEEVAPSPLPPGGGYRALWTGDEVVVLDDGDDGCAGDCDPGPDDPYAAVYDPSTDRWHAAADIPLPLRHWQRSFVVAGDDVFARVTRGGRQQLFRYDPDADRWSDLALPWAGGTELRGIGDRLVALRQCECPDLPREAVLDLPSGRWEELPAGDLPISGGMPAVEVGDELWRFEVEADESPEDGEYEVTAERVVDGRWEATTTASLPVEGLIEPVVAGDLVVFAGQPVPIDGPDRYPPVAAAFDTVTAAWVDVDPPDDPMDQGLRYADDDHLWFGNLVLDVDRRTWSAGEYVPETALGAGQVWIGDRWFAVGGVTDLAPTRRAFTWQPPA
jgi:hypothetical protein